MKKLKTLYLFAAVIILMFLGKISIDESGTDFDGVETYNEIKSEENTEENEYSQDDFTDQNYEITAESDTNSNVMVNRDYIPYTLEEIRNIFEESKDLFEKVKDICISTGYYTTIYVPSATAQFSSFTGTDGTGILYRGANDDDYFNVSEVEGYESIVELFNKYNILIVSSYDYDDHYTRRRESAIVFQMMSCPQYEQCIIYSETPDIGEEVTNEYMSGKIRLDGNWYYEHVDH